MHALMLYVCQGADFVSKQRLACHTLHLHLVSCSVQVQQCVVCLASRSVCLSLGACFDHTQLDTHSTPSRIAIGHLISMSTLAEPTSVDCICWGTHTQVQSMLQSVILPAPLSCCERKGTKHYATYAVALYMGDKCVKHCPLGGSETILPDKGRLHTASQHSLLKINTFLLHVISVPSPLTAVM